MTEQPRLMSRTEAAAYCGFTPEHFSRHISAGRLPKSLPGMHRWDRIALDKAIDALSGISSEPTDDERYAAWEAELEAKNPGRGW